MTIGQQKIAAIWIFNGVMCGYPQCCIDSFVEFGVNYPAVIRSPEQLKIGKLDYGFIPCPDHAQQIIEGKINIEDLIQNRDSSLKPFPHE